MSENRLDGIVAMLPQAVILEAAQKYVYELGRQGDLEEAERLFAELAGAGCAEVDEICRYLVSCRAFRSQLPLAIGLYERHFGDHARGQALTQRIMACHVLVMGLLPDKLPKAFELWRQLAAGTLGSEQKWHWVQTGLELLRQALKEGQRQMSEKILELMGEYGDSRESSHLLEKAAEAFAQKYGG